MTEDCDAADSPQAAPTPAGGVCEPANDVDTATLVVLPTAKASQRNLQRCDKEKAKGADFLAAHKSSKASDHCPQPRPPSYLPNLLCYLLLRSPAFLATTDVCCFGAHGLTDLDSELESWPGFFTLPSQGARCLCCFSPFRTRDSVFNPWPKIQLLYPAVKTVEETITFRTVPLQVLTAVVREYCQRKLHDSHTYRILFHVVRSSRSIGDRILGAKRFRWGSSH